MQASHLYRDTFAEVFGPGVVGIPRSIANPLAIYNILSGPLGPKPRKSLEKVSQGLWPQGPRESGKSLEKVSSLEKSRKDFFEPFPDSRGGPRAGGPGRFFQTFLRFRASGPERMANRFPTAVFGSGVVGTPESIRVRGRWNTPSLCSQRGAARRP